MLQRFVRIGLSSNARCMAYSAQAMRKAPEKGVAPGLTDIVDETTRVVSEDDLVELDMEYDRDDPKAIADMYAAPEPLQPVDLDAAMDMRSEASITAEDFEPLHNEPLDRPVELEAEYDRDDLDAIGDMFAPPPPLENVDLDAELDMRSEERITAEDFEPRQSVPLDRPVYLDAEYDMSIEADDEAPDEQFDAQEVPDKK
ncbi:hypothetical protein ACKKBF_B16970 [Auxenochlorella protothecoides x Auxenochlorella symbiontica]